VYTAPIAWVFACSLALGAGNEVFKWVDDEGKIHYGDSAPGNHDAETVKIAPPPKGASVLQSNTLFQDMEEREKLREQVEAERQKAEAVAAQEEERRRMQCRYATQELHVLEREQPVYRLDDNGDRVYLTDEERAAKIREVREQAAKFCRRGQRGSPE